MTSKKQPEALISVDIEASGPSPSVGSLLSIGACLVDDLDVAIYLELKPLPDRGWEAEAEAIHGLDRAHLHEFGLEPADAMRQLESWRL